MSFNLIGHGPVTIDVQQVVIAGWAGRDHDAVEHHIAELEAIGVARPRSVPCFYRVGAELLTSAPAIQAMGAESSGEIEVVVFSTPLGLLVGLGSDHTDRKVESYGVTVSKQMCAKPVGPDLWRMEELAPHWDQLQMRSWRHDDGGRALYQDGVTARLRDPADLIARYTGGAALPVGTAMFCGTQSVIGTLGFSSGFEMELFDPQRQRRLTHRYTVETLPIAD